MSMAGFKDIEVPFFMFFRALGVYSSKDIISYITYSFNDAEPITQRMLNILEQALTNTYADMNAILKNEFPHRKGEPAGSVNVITNQDDTLRILTRCSKYFDSYRSKLRAAGEEDALNIERFLLSKLEQNIDQKFLPHIGLTPADRKKKAAYLGHMIHRMLLVNLGVLQPTDRDSYKNKRINDAGMSYSRVFKTQFNFMVVMKLKRQYMKDFKDNSFSDINLMALFKSAIKADDFEKALMNAILHHKNKLNVLTTLRSIDTPDKGNSVKSSERAILLRQVHPTGTGYICGITSADTGAKVGMSKQLSISADITAASSSEVLKHIILEDEDLIQIQIIPKGMTLLTKHNLHKVFVNGDWLGCVQDFASFLMRYRLKRREGEINMFTTVSHNIIANEIRLWVDSWRLIRPLLIVRNNIGESGYTHTKFRQWIDFTDDHVKKLQTGAIDIDDLATDGNMGLVALTSVFANHNQAARIVFQTNQVKQTNSWALKNWAFAAHKDLYHQVYVEDPLMSTFAYRHIPPMCTNVIVAISIYGGFNQEDSLIVNKSSVDRGLFDAAHLTYDKCDIEQNEIICRPDPSNTADIKSYSNYEKLVNGLIQEGTYVQEGDGLVGKVAKLQKGDMKDPNVIYSNRSMVYRHKEPAYIWRVIHTLNHDDHEMVKIVFQTFRSI
uniref:DNA-directed RNA polymerase n=1 Tax=Phytophthora ramorum TaxID=164328 RepID=H3GK19_PHYRM